MRRSSGVKRQLFTIDDDTVNEQPAEQVVRNEVESPLTPQNAQEWQEKVAKLEDTNQRLMRFARRDQGYIDSLEKQLEKKPNDNGEKKMVAELTQKVDELTQQLEEERSKGIQMQKEMDERKSTHARQLEVVVARSAASRKDEDKRLAETSTKLEEAIRREKEAVAERAKIAEKVTRLEEYLNEAAEEQKQFKERLAEMTMKMEESSRKEMEATAKESAMGRVNFDLNKKLQQFEEDRKTLRERIDEITKLARGKQQQLLLRHPQLQRAAMQRLAASAAPLQPNETGASGDAAQGGDDELCPDMM